MIKHLYIKDFVLIDEVDLDLEPGFSAFIGETGAGKSILIDALSLLRADRASASYVAKDKKKAIVEGTFDLHEDAHALKVLEEAGFEVEDETTFTREITVSGKSTARIDHRIVSLALMKDVLRDEMDIHGQRDSQYLLNSGMHIHLLDEYISDGVQLQKVKDSYHAWKKIVDEREAALKDTYSENDLEYFRYEVQEIEAADLKNGEEEELEQKEKQYKSVKASFDKLNSILSIYDDSLAEPLHELYRLVNSLDETDALEPVKTAVSDSYYSLSDALETLRQQLDEMNLSEDEINEMEERLYTIQKLKRKYGRSIEEILAKKEDLQKQIDIISHRQEYLDEMNRKTDKAFAVYQKEAQKLHQIRAKSAPRLDQEVASSLKDLSLPNARFHTEIRPADPSAEGSDHVEFLISMNKGEDLKPLNKTASGGELSRLMLGLKEIFSRLQGIETVIFDEIDTGVSGPVAEAIGRKMQSIARDCQVFAVTHLAPVAACAKNDYLVSKSVSDNRTHTHVQHLNEKGVIDQLALISTGGLSDASRAAAEELYRRNQK